MPKFRMPTLTMTTDIVIFTIRDERLEILLIQRGNPPYQGKWALPGGLVEEDEDLDVCAHRELEEETKVTGVSLEQLHAFGAPHRDPRGRLVTVAYYTLVRPDRLHPEAARMRPMSDGSPCDELPSLAFDHAEIIAMARRRLRARLDESADAFGFLPKTFTLEELRNGGRDRRWRAARSPRVPAPGVGPRADRGHGKNKDREAAAGAALPRGGGSRDLMSPTHSLSSVDVGWKTGDGRRSSGGIVDNATLPGEDHPEARARNIDNLKRIGLAMGGYACANGGRFPAGRDPHERQATSELASRPPAVPGRLPRGAALQEVPPRRALGQRAQHGSFGGDAGRI